VEGSGADPCADLIEIDDLLLEPQVHAKRLLTVMIIWLRARVISKKGSLNELPIEIRQDTIATMDSWLASRHRCKASINCINRRLTG
jgi:hypothetical protein